MTQDAEYEEASDLTSEIFQKCMLVMLAHVQRRIAEDDTYEEPRFLKAMMIAFQQLGDDVKSGENVMGVSVSDEKDDPQEGYAVVMKKHKTGYEIVSHKDIVFDQEIGLPHLFKLIELSIRLDNIDEKTVKWSRAINLLNQLMPDVSFVKYPINQWKRGRSKLIENIWRGNIHGLSPLDLSVVQLKEAKKFEEVPQAFRQLIASEYAAKKSPNKSAMGISSPDKDIDKAKVFELARMVLYGPASRLRKGDGLK